jgi:hypothetical protein
VVADVAELAHKPVPARSPAADHPITVTLKARGGASLRARTRAGRSAHDGMCAGWLQSQLDAQTSGARCVPGAARIR